jgi:hypothetical protein
MQENKSSTLKIKVIVRSWGDEPVELFLQHIDKYMAYVGKEDSDTVIGLPLEQVFLFDNGAFSRLRVAFESGRLDKLDSLYRKLVVNSTCNRYQDVLESLHDKENITDSGSATESGER